MLKWYYIQTRKHTPLGLAFRLFDCTLYVSWQWLCTLVVLILTPLNAVLQLILDVWDTCIEGFIKPVSNSWKAMFYRSDVPLYIGEDEDEDEGDDYPSWICEDCGRKHGNRKCGWATWHCGDKCGVCGEEKQVTEPRDFGHLKDTWKAE